MAPSGGRNLDFALHVTADMAEAHREVRQLTGEITDLGNKGKQAGTGVAVAGTAINGKLAPALGKAELAAKRAGISLGQYNMAMRQLPMQMTDIFTGLASGQSPFMVLMQQGGQLKDSFGGVVPAARALGSQLLGLVNPYTVVAAAGVALVAAWNEAEGEVSAFNRALVESGGYAGRTAEQLSSLAAEMDGLDGVTTGSAADAIAAVTATGRITGQEFEAASRAAAVWSAATGESVDSVVARFVKLADDPVKAILALNRSQHFLTAETLEQIRSLVEQGQHAEAVSLAIRTYSGVLIERAPQMTENLGNVEWAMKGLKDAARESADAVIGLFRAPTNGSRINELQSNIESMQKLIGNHHWWNAGGVYGSLSDEQLRALIARFQAEIQRLRMADDGESPDGKTTVDSDEEARADEERKKREQERKRFFDAETRYLSDSEKKTRERAAVQDLLNRKVIDQEEATKRLDQIEADYAERAKKRAAQRKTEAQHAEDAAQRALEELTKQVALTDTLDDSQKRVAEEDRISYEITAGKFRLASQGIKDQLLQQARLLDATRAEREETGKAKDAYDALKNSLQTPIDAAVVRVTQQMQDLQKAMGLMPPDEAARRQQQIIDQSITALPNIGADALWQYGIGDDESDRLAQMRAHLEAEYQVRREIINAARQQENADQEKWNKASEDLEAQHQAQLTALTQAEGLMRLGQISNAFNSMAEIARSFGGEQSKTYQAMFALSQGFAAAQSAVSLGIAMSKAMEQPWPKNLADIATVVAEFANISAIISGARFSPAGYAGGGQIRGPGTPTSDSIPIWASDREFMVRAASATQPGAVDFLNDFNQRGMLALHDWARGFADGGQITAMAEPAANISDNAALMRPASNNSLRLYNLFDRDALAEMLVNHPAFDKRVVVVASENGGTIRSSW